MRLLQYNGDGDFSLAEIFKSTIPEYAILSHTWEGDEVTFEDLQNGTGTKKAGYEKIRFCAEQAKRDGLQYFWVDTCCIDKSNSAELAEAINSMFRWYRMSTKCYVYLPDISRTAVNTDDLGWESAFRKCKWFTRGWTLQELIAPTSVEFFCRDSKRIGSKRSLEQLIHEITGIPKSALQGARLSQFSDKERFSWIQPRQTKVEEDKAYSLLGIFDVQMPLRYGEGMANAFKRLEEEIDKFNKCLQDLRLSDPRDDKTRIEDTKGGLLEGSYHWVLETSDFQQWRNNPQTWLLWIKGDPGKGKTMLLCGIINELKKSISNSTLLSYFFCQATDSRINSATAVLRGLIYLLVNEQPSLITHVRKKYEQTGKALFEDTNAWVALYEIFARILQDPRLNSTCLIVDALDECVVDLPKLLDLIVQTSFISLRIKWIVSSRNWPSIEKSLNKATQKASLHLELNEKSVSAAVNTYIQSKVDFLATQNEYDNDARGAVQSYLSANANGTFLWVALVCQELASISGWEVEEMLSAFPPGLDAIYMRMIEQIRISRAAKRCKSILAVVSIVYRPITLDELPSFVDIPPRSSSNYKALAEIIGLCGSFLTIRERTIFFVHQSARDFLIKEVSNDIFPSGINDINHAIFSQSLQVMSRILRRDIYSLRVPGISIDQVKQPDPDPLAAIRYSCLYWVDHLLDCQTRDDKIPNLKNSGSVYNFLRQYFLYWLEALSLMRSLSSGIVLTMKLEVWLQTGGSPDLFAFIYDAKRFTRYYYSLVEKRPLQLYCSALVFAPDKSIVRKQFEKCIPPWIRSWPKMEAHWNAALQTLEGHTDMVSSVAFSPDSKHVVSGSHDKTVRLWDAATGALQQTLEGHTSSVRSVAFSLDGKQVVSGSNDKTVRLWNAATRALQQTLEGHTDQVSSVAFSPDSKQVISGSHDKTVRLWDAATGALKKTLAIASQQTLEGHTYWVSSVAFSPDGKQVISGSYDNTVRLWDAATGALQQTLEGHIDWVRSVAFSPDSKQVISGSDDKTIRFWDAATGALQQTLEGHTYTILCIAFSPNSKQIVSGSQNTKVRLWDTATGALQQTFEGHTGQVTSVAFSLDGKQVVSSSSDTTIRLWDAATEGLQKTFDDCTDSVTSVAFSPDGKQVMSSSQDKTVRLWDAATGALQYTLKGHTDWVKSAAFSLNGKQIVSGSDDKTLRLWDAATGALQQILKGHTGWVTSVAFSPNSKHVVSGSYDNTVRLWDAATGALRTLEGHTDRVSSVAFSPNSKQILSGSHDKTVRLWDTSTGALQQTFKGPDYWVSSVAFSPNGKQIISGLISGYNDVQLWDVATGAQQQTLRGYTDHVSSAGFSPDGKLETLRVSDGWVLEGISQILWLTHDFQSPTCQATWNGCLVFGYSSGRVLVFRFPLGAKLIV